MNRTCALASVAIAVAATAWAIGGADHKKEAMEAAIHRPDGLKWQDGPPSLPPGAKIAVLEGDPPRRGRSCSASRCRTATAFRLTRIRSPNG